MNNLRSLTEKQRDVLLKLEVILEQQTKRLLEACPEGTPTSWMNVDALVRIYKVNRGTINGLIRHGCLSCRTYDGQGKQVRKS